MSIEGKKISELGDNSPISGEEFVAIVQDGVNKKARLKDIIADAKVVDHGTGDAVFALTPNVYHIWGEMESLEVSESAGEQGQMNVYMFEFTSGASATQLTYPGTWKWMGGTAPVIAPNKRYQIGVLNNLAKIDEYE